ncbi:MAG: FAD-dependent oxidoreductase [Acidimicrobiales bacterium]
MYDVIIIGGGPTGASAAIFTARAELSTVVIDADKGITRRAMLENHLGFADGITGPELVDAGRAQAERFGVTWVEDSADRLDDGPGGTFVVATAGGETVEGRQVILATGLNPAFAKNAGIALTDGTEPRVATIAEVDPDGRTNRAGVWAAGAFAGTSVHTIITAGDGARVAINLISGVKGERWVDHDVLPTPEA